MAVYLARFIPVNDVERAVYFSHFSIPRLHLPLGGSAGSLRAARFLSRQHRCRLYSVPTPATLQQSRTPLSAASRHRHPVRHQSPTHMPVHSTTLPRKLLPRPPTISLLSDTSPSAPSSAFQAPPRLLLAALLKPFFPRPFLPARCRPRRRPRTPPACHVRDTGHTLHTDESPPRSRSRSENCTAGTALNVWRKGAGLNA